MRLIDPLVAQKVRGGEAKSMRWTRLLTAILAATTIMIPCAVYAETSAVPERDAREIHAALQGMDDAWNQHDMKAFVSFMTEDVEWVNVVGMWWKGKDKVYQAHQAYHQTIFKNRQFHKPETVELKLIAPGAVLATTIAVVDGFTTPSGHVEPAGRSVLTEIFVHRDGKWLVLEGHNTTLVEEAQKSNPVK
jgi:uncharacterized protein (TIGR02246 family)